MPLNSIKTQLHHYLRDLAIDQAWRTLGITFIFFKVMGFFFPGWLYLDGCVWSKGQSFLPHKIYLHVFYSCTFYSTGEGNWGWFRFPCTIAFFFSFWLMMLWLYCCIPSGKNFFVKSVSVVYTLKSELPNVELQRLALWSL